MLLWAEKKRMTVEELADGAECSAAHLRNIFAGRKEASLRLAHRLSELSGGKVPMEAFLKPDEARV
jgi:hypothetical protein